LAGTAIGIGVIQASNVFRVTALFLIGSLRMRAVFHDTHVYVAQALVVCVAVALWLYWATRFCRCARALPRLWFLLKLVALLVVTYMLWAPLAPYYAVFLLRVSQVAVWLTEFSSDPNWQHPTQMLIKLSVSPTALLFYHTHFTQYASGIPAEWVMANMVLLIPLMLATPVVTWRERFVKLGLALLLAVVLQVFDVVVGIKAYYAANVRGAFGPIATEVYQFLDAFVQSWDTQLSGRDLGRCQFPASSCPSGSSPRVRR
jgi:hypothetical protein